MSKKILPKYFFQMLYLIIISFNNKLFINFYLNVIRYSPKQ